MAGLHGVLRLNSWETLNFPLSLERGHEMKRRIGLVAAIVMLVTACSGGAPEDQVASAADWPAATAATPLEVRKALERLDVFGECFDASEVTETDPNFFLVNCVMVPYENTATGVRSVYADRGVAVLMFKQGEWPGTAWVCGNVGADSGTTAVTDNATFFAVGVPSRDSAGMGWPPEVWPADIAVALGGKEVTFEEFGCPPAT